MNLYEKYATIKDIKDIAIHEIYISRLESIVIIPLLLAKF